MTALPEVPRWPKPSAFNLPRDYERARADAALARLRELRDAAVMACAELDDDCPITAARCLREALNLIGDLPA